MNLQQLQGLLDELLRGIQDVIQSGEILSDEFQGMLAQELNYLTSQIDIMSGQETVTPPKIPELNPGNFPSAQVNAYKYDPTSQDLFVKFHGKDSSDSGPTYKYSGVPKFIYDVFSRGAVGPKTTGQNQYHAWKEGVTPSLGAALNALVKNGGYQYQRMG